MEVNMKKWLLILCALGLLGATCVSNPLTGKSTMALVSDSELFPMSFQQYAEFIAENKVITGTPQAQMVERVGTRIREAAEKWFASEGRSDYLKNYRWEYKLIESNEVNAWCMPGGKIVIYTGILPVTQTEDGLATVMGHEVSHALLNHGQQRMSAGVLQQMGAEVLGQVSDSTLIMAAYGIGTELGGTLPFSRKHESEADHYGLILMAIAGYNPDASVPFWERMSVMGGGGTPEFLSTHPSDSTRIRQLQDWIPEAKRKAVELGGNK
jgi:predicted Zn-dependent protease